MISWNDYLINQKLSSESSTENWVLSQVIQSNKKYKIVESS